MSLCGSFLGPRGRGAFACKQPLQSLCTITAASAEAPAAQVQPTTAWLLRHPYALQHSQGEHPPIHARTHTSTSRPCPVVYCVGILYFVPCIGLVLCIFRTRFQIVSAFGGLSQFSRFGWGSTALCVGALVSVLTGHAHQHGTVLSANQCNPN